MPSVLLVVFVIQLLLHTLNTLIGGDNVNQLLWAIYIRLPTPQSDDARKTLQYGKEAQRLKREMAAVSAQDDFAKWARLRRGHDKAKEQYEKAAASQQSTRQMFNRIMSAVRWLGTQGVNFLINTYFGSTPMFWLPQGWVPYYAEWVLSCPRAPLGSISVNVWGIACGSVIAMLSEAVRATITLKQGEVIEGANKGEKLKMEAISIPPVSKNSKKEL
ncbi:putative Get1 family, helix hairpin bin domain superfamily protein [Acrodontium crateriforme]|uniref:Get1 family, helix hairpin bin domain superfamily protein n=1 Tax=Acrodontium crateriforme TaxID=150365 RepID=A0AAQ3M4S6_9PEZI|nr:putative Get1 family, helix hairpin bin domain superfamily protein [Acrodontium crateriforme]